MKIPSTDFNNNNLNEITLKDKLRYICHTQPDEEVFESKSKLKNFGLIKLNKNSENEKLNNKRIGNFNSNDNFINKTFSPKIINNSCQNIFSFKPIMNTSKFPKIPDKYSDIANIIKKDICENYKKEMEMDITRKYSSMSNNNTKGKGGLEILEFNHNKFGDQENIMLDLSKENGKEE